MSTAFKLPRVVAAIHLLPSAVSKRPDAFPLDKIIEHAVIHAQIAKDGGVRAVYIQDTNDVPYGARVHPQTAQNMIAVGTEVRKAFPDLFLGVTTMAHGATEALDVAKAVGADFVRLKVYVGAMVKMEGIVHGCAFEAIQHRAEIGADHIRILADVYDRLGVPLAAWPIAEACRQAVDFGRADGLILTGKTIEESVRMFDDVRPLRLPVPLVLGGGLSPSNLKFFDQRADAFLIHGAFVKRGLPRQNGVPIEWDADLIRQFVTAAR